MQFSKEMAPKCPSKVLRVVGCCVAHLLSEKNKGGGKLRGLRWPDSREPMRGSVRSENFQQVRNVGA